MALLTAQHDERRRVGFGLLGYGFMGKAHSNALRTIPYIFWPSVARPELIAIAGRSEAGVREAATRYGYGAYTTDWLDLLADERVEVFDNVAADDAHVEPTLAAIHSGKHVVCEKPLASNATDALRLYEAASSRGVKHLVCFNYRFFPAVRLAWEMLNRDELGPPNQARFRYSQEWRAGADATLPSPTGVLGIIGCHVFDQARFLCGEIKSVSAAITSTTDERSYRGRLADTDDAVAVVAQFDSGLVAMIDASLVSPGRRNHLAWEINCAKGSLAWNLEEPNVLHVYRRGDTRTGGFTKVIACESEHALAAPWWPSGHVLGWEHGHANMLAHFIDAIATEASVEPFGATFYDGLRAAQIAEAVGEAARTGHWVKVPSASQGAALTPAASPSAAVASISPIAGA
jgi:predicted dehydrogenase